MTTSQVAASDQRHGEPAMFPFRDESETDEQFPWWIRYVMGPGLILYFLTLGAGIGILCVYAVFWICQVLDIN